MRHILTFDIEHWYESWRQRGLPGYEGFSDCDSAIVKRLYDLLDETGHKATFFFTGRFMREFPVLGKECASRGHEVASHSDQHTLLTDFRTFADIREDTVRSVDSIEQIVGQKVLGYRAPKWSLPPAAEADFYALLAELGLEYDSSFFSTRRTGPGRLSPHNVTLARGGTLTELPATALKMGPLTLPCGGAYFRLLPLFMTRLMMYQCRARGVPGMLYAHPYDLNPSCHMVPESGLFLRWMRTVGVKGALPKLQRLLAAARFRTAAAWVRDNKNSLPAYAAAD